MDGLTFDSPEDFYSAGYATRMYSIRNDRHVMRFRNEEWDFKSADADKMLKPHFESVGGICGCKIEKVREVAGALGVKANKL